MEFEELTVSQLEALEARRAVSVRHARFNAALVVSAIVNSNRAPDSRPLSPFDFIAGFEPDAAEEERAQERLAIRRSIAATMASVTPENFQETKDKVIARAIAAGFADAEDIYREIFPD